MNTLINFKDLSSFVLKIVKNLSEFMLSLLVSLLIKKLVSLGPHSGINQPPLFGDMEAHRNWMYVTRFQTDWYKFNTQYWGLDYPPLAAYHAYIFSLFNNYLEMPNSESLYSINYMRLTSLISDLVFFSFPLILYFNNKFTLFLALTIPPFVIIDHGHFQYNSTMLGCFILVCLFFKNNHFIAGAVAFVACIGFKQTALYYSFPVFFFLLGISIKRGVGWFIKLSMVVVFCFILLFGPFYNQLGTVFTRYCKLT